MSTIETLERVRYFAGRLLTVEDFEREQSYHLDRARRHNRFLHGWGVVFGLEVSVTGQGDVEITPGLAIDCAGNELVVPSPMSACIPRIDATQYVALRYKEEEVQPVPGLTSGTEATCIREAAELLLLDSNPSLGHRGIGPRTPGCGQAHPLCLAMLKPGRGGWKLQRAKRGT